MADKEQVEHNIRRRYYEARSRENLKTRIKRLYEEGYSQHEMAKMMGIPRGTISRWMVEARIHGREPGMAGKLKSQRYHYNETIFENITDPNTAYVVGFIMGDGCVHDRSKSKRLAITLAISDRQILEDIAKYLDAEKLLKVRNAANSREQKKISLIINCTQMCNNLIQWGVTENKTGKEIFPEFDSNNLKWAFLRGFFDADGYIRSYLRNGYTKAKFTLTGNEQMMRQVKSFLEVQGFHLPGKRIFPKQGCVSFEISSVVTLRKLYSSLYSEDTGTLHLVRKKQVFSSLMI